jgi:ADP-heptose:LPS heptosyltransferase
VVTTSNVTAHLAGALGKRTFVVFLRGRPPFHYWSSPDGRCLWYPSVELVSGAAIDTWEKALAEVHGRLFG